MVWPHTSIQRNVAPATTVVGSPSATPSIALSNPVVVPSHSGATTPSVSCKRKVVAPDTSATSSERSSSLSLIENVDMGEFIEDLMNTKVPPPAYRRIQDFLTKVCVHFYCFSLSFNVFEHLFCFLILFSFFHFRLEQGVLIQTPSLRSIRALISCLQMCPRTYVSWASPPHPRMFLSRTSNLPLTSRFCLHLQMPTFMTMASSSLRMLPILKFRDQFITGLTRRNSMLPRTGSA